MDATGNCWITGSYGNYTISFGSTVTLTQMYGFDKAFIAKLSSITGINETLVEDGIIIYPNPTRGLFTISLPTDNSEILVTDLLGQQILKTQTTQKTTILQLDNNGVYIVYIKTNQGTTTRKLILKR